MLNIEKRIIIPLRLGVVSKLVVSQRKVVKAFSSSVGRLAENVREETDAFLLFDAGGGFYEALRVWIRKVPILRVKKENTPKRS